MSADAIVDLSEYEKRGASKDEVRIFVFGHCLMFRLSASQLDWLASLYK